MDKCIHCGSTEFVQRQDDKPEVVKRRIKVFETEIMPVVNYYKDQGDLHIIDGSKSVQAISAEIDKILSRGKDD